MTKKIYFSLPAINETSNGFTSSGGFPIVKFQIPSQNSFLETTTLRLSGRMQIKSTSANVIHPDDIDFDNMDENGDSGDQQICSAVTIPPFGGCKCAIDKVVIESKKSRQELASITNYSQYLSLRESRMGVESDFRNSMACRSFSLGENAAFAQRRMTISNLSDITSADKVGQEFSVKLDVDLLQNQLLNLDENHLGGLIVTLHLNVDSAFLATYQNGIRWTPAISISNYSFTFKELRLEGRYVIPDSVDMKFIPETIPLDNQINLLQDIHASRSAGVLTPQAQLVKGINNVFLLQDQTNNLVQSQYSFMIPPGVRQIEQLKNNVRNPYKFPVKSVPNFQTPNAADVTDYSFPSLATNFSEERLQFERGLGNGYLPSYTSATLVLTDTAMESSVAAVDADQNTAKTSSNLDVDSTGIGVDYTGAGMNIKQNFKNQDYTLSLSSGVNTSNGNLLDYYNNQSLLQQTFVRNTAIMDTKTLIRTM